MTAQLIPTPRDTHGSRQAPLQPTVHILGKNKFCARSAALCPVSCRPASHSTSLLRSGYSVKIGKPHAKPCDNGTKSTWWVHGWKILS